MIKSISIKNFGKHESLDLELHPGVNIICGKSARGKSWSAPRPLRWVAKNKPLGDGIRNWGGGDTSVGIILEDGTLIVRAKNKDNVYLLDQSGLTEPHQEFRAFGRNPPEEIQKILNLDDINFQSQHDPLYLLSMSPPEVAKVLNRLAGLDKIDEAFGKINKRLWNEQQERKTAEKLKGELEEELEKYIGLDKLDVDLAVIKELEDRALKAKGRAGRIAWAVERVEISRVEEGKYAGVDGVSKKLGDTERTVEELDKVKQKGDKVAGSISRMERALKEERKYAGYERVAVMVWEIGEALKEPEIMRTKAGKIRELVGKVEETGERAEELGKELAGVEDEFHRLMPEECPLCGMTARNL